jgi:hypothetical protein
MRSLVTGIGSFGQIRLRYQAIQSSLWSIMQSTHYEPVRSQNDPDPQYCRDIVYASLLKRVATVSLISVRVISVGESPLKPAVQFMKAGS